MEAPKFRHSVCTKITGIALHVLDRQLKNRKLCDTEEGGKIGSCLEELLNLEKITIFEKW